MFSLTCSRPSKQGLFWVGIRHGFRKGQDIACSFSSSVLCLECLKFSMLRGTMSRVASSQGSKAEGCYVTFNKDNYEITLLCLF